MQTFLAKFMHELNFLWKVLNLSVFLCLPLIKTLKLSKYFSYFICVLLIMQVAGTIQQIATSMCRCYSIKN